jgi:hypothetical protein
MKIVKWFFGLVLLAFLGTELNKAYWDSKVKALCEKGGGVTVFERVELSKKEFENLGGNKHGQIHIPSAQIAKDDYPFYSELSISYIRDGYLKVYKNEGRIFRRHDKKLLGLMVDYGRSGGDFPTGFHPSSFGCIDLVDFKLDVEKQVFVIKGE